jgi:hypothetical protein
VTDSVAVIKSLESLGAKGGTVFCFEITIFENGIEIPFSPYNQETRTDEHNLESSAFAEYTAGKWKRQ